jgi:hypothetical protein
MGGQKIKSALASAFTIYNHALLISLLCISLFLLSGPIRQFSGSLLEIADRWKNSRAVFASIANR